MQIYAKIIISYYIPIPIYIYIYSIYPRTSPQKFLLIFPKNTKAAAQSHAGGFECRRLLSEKGV